MRVNISRTSAYLGSASVAALSVVASLFLISMSNGEDSPLPLSEQVRNEVFNFIFFFAVMLGLGLLWSLPFRSVADHGLMGYRINHRVLYPIAGALSGLAGFSVALGIGTLLAGPAPLDSWLFYCPGFFVSGLLGGYSYAWLLERLRAP